MTSNFYVSANGASAVCAVGLLIAGIVHAAHKYPGCGDDDFISHEEDLEYGSANFAAVLSGLLAITASAVVLFGAMMGSIGGSKAAGRLVCGGSVAMLIAFPLLGGTILMSFFLGNSVGDIMCYDVACPGTMLTACRSSQYDYHSKDEYDYYCAYASKATATIVLAAITALVNIVVFGASFSVDRDLGTVHDVREVAVQVPNSEIPTATVVEQPLGNGDC